MRSGSCYVDYAGPPRTTEGTLKMAKNLVRAAAEALAVSDLDHTANPRPHEVRAAVASTLRQHGGASGCAVQRAIRAVTDPITTELRMAWAHGIVRSLARTA